MPKLKTCFSPQRRKVRRENLKNKEVRIPWPASNICGLGQAETNPKFKSQMFKTSFSPQSEISNLKSENGLDGKTG